MPSAMMLLNIPDDPALLAAAARVAIGHGHLELVLKRTVKTINQWDLEAADTALKRTPVATVRKWIAEDTRRRLGDAPEAARMFELLDSARALSDRRNDLMHGIWATGLDGGRPMHHGDGGWTLPNSAELDRLAQAIKQLADEINHARLEGWFAEVLSRSPEATNARRELPKPRNLQSSTSVPVMASRTSAAEPPLSPTKVSAISTPQRPTHKGQTV